MKKIVSIMAVALISFGALAQNNAIDKYFSKYQEDDLFTKVNVSGKMFDLAEFLETEDEEVQEFKDLASGVENLKALIAHEMPNGFSAYEDATFTVSRDFEELMSVDDKDGKVTFYIDEKGGVVNEFVAVGAADSALVLVSIVGKIDLRKLGSVMQKVQSEDFEFFSKIDENGASDIKVYPNPASTGESVIVEIPEELENAQVTVYSATGSKVNAVQRQSNKATINTSDLSSGMYYIEFRTGESAIKKKFIVR